MTNKFKFFTVLAVIFLSACSSTPERSYCPRYALISELDRVPVATALTPHGEIRITQIAGRCDDNAIDLGFKTSLALMPNDSSTIEKEIPYFVATVDEADNVLNRKDFVLKVKLAGPEDIQVYKQNYKFISNFDWKTMRILVGLTLTPAQRQQNTFVKIQHEQAMSADMHTQQIAKVQKLSGQ
jgi:hypothetical protein